MLFLADTATAAADNAPHSVPSALASQLLEAAQRLVQQLPDNARSMAQEPAAALRLAPLRGVVQPAADLAALMQQYYALPAVAAERQLALAQAAAGRSCAYLRCANLGGEGGPAAGQGVGSMRCRCDARGWVGRACAAAWLGGACCAAVPTSAPAATIPTAPVARCGTAAPPARTPTGGRAGTAACAGRWVRRGGRPRRRRRQRQRARGSADIALIKCLICTNQCLCEWQTAQLRTACNLLRQWSL